MSLANPFSLEALLYFFFKYNSWASEMHLEHMLLIGHPTGADPKDSVYA